MKILLNDKTTVEAVFVEIDIDTLRKEFRKAQSDPEKIPAKFKALIAMPDYPGKLVEMTRKEVV
jgi:hypothetical protein